MIKLEEKSLGVITNLLISFVKLCAVNRDFGGVSTSYWDVHQYRRRSLWMQGKRMSKGD